MAILCLQFTHYIPEESPETHEISYDIDTYLYISKNTSFYSDVLIVHYPHLRMTIDDDDRM